MRRILVTGAGGAAAGNFIRSIRLAPEPFHLVGVDCSKYHLALSPTDERYLVPKASESDYIDVLHSLVLDCEIDFLFAQPDPEVRIISDARERLCTRTYLPAKATVALCQDKYWTYCRWQAEGLKVPRTQLVSTPGDLEELFTLDGEVWLRPAKGAAGRGSLLARDLDQAKAWIDFQGGWGAYTAAEYLSPDSVTWQSVWRDGELVVAQGRKRLYWEFADRTLSGITGITGAGVTISDPLVDDIAMRAIYAVDARPHGVFSVDLTYDRDGLPNPTEINIGRFFTTHLFFSRAGLNMPYIVVKLAFDEEPELAGRLNPLPEGLVWVRGMDSEPAMTSLSAIDQLESGLERRRSRLGAGALPTS